MKKEILEALTAKFPGVSASVLGRIADKLAKTATTQEQVTTAVEGVTIQQIIDSEADRRVTEGNATARRNAIADYEKQHGLKDGVKVQTQKEDEHNQNEKPPKEEIPKWAQTLMEEVKSLKSSRVAETRKARMESLTGKLSENMRKAYARIPLDKYSDEEFETMLTEISAEVEGIADIENQEGGILGQPKSGNGGQTKKASDAETDAVADRICI